MSESTNNMCVQLDSKKAEVHKFLPCVTKDDFNKVNVILIPFLIQSCCNSKKADQ